MISTSRDRHKTSAYRVAVLGKVFSGCTSLITRLTENEFRQRWDFPLNEMHYMEMVLDGELI